jgi:hypothetical protein
VSNISNTVGPSSEWPATTRTTVSMQTKTAKRLQKYFTHYGSTYDSIINELLDKVEEGEEKKDD